MATTYTVSTSNSIWAKSLVALCANAEAHESGESDPIFDWDFIEAISYSLDMWLDGPIDLTDEQLRTFAFRLDVFADRIADRQRDAETWEIERPTPRPL